jgi:hypothetical protein
MKSFPFLWLAVLASVAIQQTAVVHAEAPVTTSSIKEHGLVSYGDVSRLAAAQQL